MGKGSAQEVKAHLIRKNLYINACPVIKDWSAATLRQEINNLFGCVLKNSSGNNVRWANLLVPSRLKYKLKLNTGADNKCIIIGWHSLLFHHGQLDWWSLIIIRIFIEGAQLAKVEPSLALKFFLFITTPMPSISKSAQGGVGWICFLNWCNL